jgi:hypothetical protein
MGDSASGSGECCRRQRHHPTNKKTTGKSDGFRKTLSMQAIPDWKIRGAIKSWPSAALRAINRND